MAKSVSLLCTISWAYTSLYLQVLWDSSCSPTSACKPWPGSRFCFSHLPPVVFHLVFTCPLARGIFKGNESKRDFFLCPCELALLWMLASSSGLAEAWLLGNGERLQDTYFSSTENEWTCFTGPKDPCLKAVLLDLLNYLDPLRCCAFSTSSSGDRDPIGCSWCPGSLTDFLLFQNTEMVTWVKASTSLLRFWDLRYPFITKIPSHPSVSDLDAPSFGPWYIATHLTAPQFCCEGSAADQTLTFALFLSLQQCFIYGYVAK